MYGLNKTKSYRGPSFRYKIKKIVSNNKTGDSYAINIPKVMADMFENVSFNMYIAGDSIVLASGCLPLKTVKKKQPIFEEKVFE